jgi:hypothetical protein
MLVARKMKIITRFEKKLVRFENTVRKHQGPGKPQRQVTNMDDDFFDLNNSQEDKDLIDNFEM